jgi:hypothetical protein
MSVVYVLGGSCAPSLTSRNAGLRMAVSQMRRSTSAGDRTASKRPGSSRATTSGRRCQCSARKTSGATGSSVSPSASAGFGLAWSVDVS